MAAVLAFIPLTFLAFWGSLAYTLIGRTIELEKLNEEGEGGTAGGGTVGQTRLGTSVAGAPKNNDANMAMGPKPLAVGTILTLVFLPALYSIWFRMKPTDGGHQRPEAQVP